jgi:hypothetical protein
MSELHLREVARFYTWAHPVNAAYPGPVKKTYAWTKGMGPETIKTASTAAFRAGRNERMLLAGCCL